MTTKTNPIPEGFHSVTPYLILKGAAPAIDFYKKAFGAQERFRLPMPDGRVGHAELLFGNSVVMLADEFPEHGHKSVQTLNGSPVGFAFYVADVDKAFQQAVNAGAKVKEPVADKFYGDRAGTVTDPFGYQWTVMTHVEDVPPDEMKRRMEKFCASGSDKKDG